MRASFAHGAHVKRVAAVLLRRLALLALAAPLAAFASPWQQSVALPLTLEYDFNPDLAPGSEESAWRSRLMPRYTLLHTSGNDELQATVSLVLERSWGAARAEDRADPALTLGWKRTTEKGELGAQVEYERMATRMASQDDAAFADGDATQSSKSVEGYWRHALTERFILSLDWNYRDISYSRGAFVDYSTVGGSMSASYALTPRVEPYVRFSTVRYEVTANGDESKVNAGVIGLRWQQSEQVEWNLNAGANRTTGLTTGNGWQAGLAGKYVGERTQSGFELARFVSPSARGGLDEADNLRGNVSYALNEKTQAGIDWWWRKTYGLRATDLRQLGFQLRHELSETWSGLFFVRSRWRDDAGVGQATGHVAGMSLIYAHPDF